MITHSNPPPPPPRRYMKFRSIEELPIWNWNKIKEEEDFRYLLKLDDYFDLPVPDPEVIVELGFLWEKVKDQFTERFGFPDQFKRIEKKRIEIDLLMLDFIITGDIGLQTLIQVKRKQLEGMIKKIQQDSDQPFEEQVVILESHFKLAIDTHKVSVLRYYSYVNIFEADVERARKGIKDVK